MKIKRLATQWIPNLALAAGILVFIRFDLSLLAFGLVLVSKWQIVLGGPKLWVSSIRYNACDLVVAIGTVVLLLTFATSPLVQLLLTLAYAAWLIFIKPRSTPFWMAIQAAICQFIGVWTIFLYGRIMILPLVLVLSWVVALVAADHFFAAHNDPARNVLTFVWGLLAAQLSWLLGRWLIVYPLFNGALPIPQASLIITVMSYTFANMYMDHANKRLHKLRLAEYIGLATGIMILIVLGTRWHTRL